MEYDSIPLARMSPDSSVYQKGVDRVVNAIPTDADGWRELTVPEVAATEALAVGSFPSGYFSSPSGDIYVGVSRSAGPSSRLYQFVPASNVFTNLTPASDFAGAPTRWRFAAFGPTTIAAPENAGVGTAQPMWARGSTGNFAQLTVLPDQPSPKYICTSKSHVVGAFNQAGAGTGLYAAEDPYQFMWCSRNNAAVWTPGADRAGFASVNTAAGRITGVLGFTDFFLIFQELGVQRATWIGGDAVWDLQQIATGQFGVSNTLWSDGIVAVGRDAIYFSNGGPAAIRNGEAAEAVGDGEVRKHFLDEIPSTGTVSSVATLRGDYSPRSRVIVWSYGSSGGDRRFLAHHVASGRFSVVDHPSIALADGVAPALRVVPVLPFEEIVAFGASSLAGVAMRATRFTYATAPARTTLPSVFTLKRWRPETGQRAGLHGIRPLVLVNLNGGSYPTVTVALAVVNDPVIGVTDTVTITSASRDQNGWYTNYRLPLEGNEFRPVVTIGDLGNLPTLKEVPAMELAFEPGSVF